MANDKNYVVLDQVEGIGVLSWCPSSTPNVPATQVHVHIDIGKDATIVLRFQGPRTLDSVIAALQKHREDVWGPKT